MTTHTYYGSIFRDSLRDVRLIRGAANWFEFLPGDESHKGCHFASMIPELLHQYADMVEEKPAVAWMLKTGHGTGFHEGATPPVKGVGWRPLFKSPHSGWRDIQSAPKSTRHVFLFGNGPGIVQCTVVGSWHEDSQKWRLVGGGEFFPTHWMPMFDGPDH